MFGWVWPSLQVCTALPNRKGAVRASLHHDTPTPQADVGVADGGLSGGAAASAIAPRRRAGLPSLAIGVVANPQSPCDTPQTTTAPPAQTRRAGSARAVAATRPGRCRMGGGVAAAFAIDWPSTAPETPGGQQQKRQRKLGRGKTGGSPRRREAPARVRARDYIPPSILKCNYICKER